MNRWPNNVAVLIPAYKAAPLLRDLLPKLLAVTPNKNVFVIDDASEDETPQICNEFQITCFRHAVNRGKGAALATGFSHLTITNIKWIITMDADGQHSPDDLQKFLEASLTVPKVGICIGARTMKPGKMPPERILSNRLTSGILSFFCGICIIDSQCGYRIYSIDLLKQISIQYNRFEMESEIIMKAAFLGFPVTFTTIQTLYLKGPSHISHVFDTLRWIAAVVRIRLQRRSIINNRHPHEL